MKNFQKKTSQYLVTFLVMALVVAFLLQTEQAPQMGSPDDVGSVGPLRITQREYGMALQNLSSRYSQIFGGKDLTPAQMRQFNLYNTALEQIAQQKLITLLGQDIGVRPTKDEIADAIRQTPYFNKDGQFRVDLYRNLLQANGFTPAQFEEQFRQDISAQKAYGAFENFPVSRNYLETYQVLQSSGVKVIGAQLKADVLKNLIPIPNEKIQSFISDESNKELLENLYQRNIEKYVTPERFQAQHILLTAKENENDSDLKKRAKNLRSQIKASNFNEMAKKHSQDPGSKDKNGDLGWVTRGMMVPEFEEALFNMKAGEISDVVQSSYGYHIIKAGKKEEETRKELPQVAKELALEHLRGQETEALKTLIDKNKATINELLKSAQYQNLKKQSLSLGAEIIEEQTLSFVNPSLSKGNLSEEDLNKLLKSNSGDVVVFDKGDNSLIVKVQGPTQVEKVEQEQFEQNQQKLESQAQQAFMEKIMENLKKSYKVHFRPIQS